MLSNLLWWPWHGLGTGEPPSPGEDLVMGGRPLAPQGRPPPTTPVFHRVAGDDEEIEIILYLLTVS